MTNGVSTILDKNGGNGHNSNRVNGHIKPLPSGFSGGWTQQQIADDLKVPLGTIDTWLRKYISNDVAKNVRSGSGITDMSSYPFTEIQPHPIRLFPCR